MQYNNRKIVVTVLKLTLQQQVITMSKTNFNLKIKLRGNTLYYFGIVFDCTYYNIDSNGVQ